MYKFVSGFYSIIIYLNILDFCIIYNSKCKFILWLVQDYQMDSPHLVVVLIMERVYDY